MKKVKLRSYLKKYWFFALVSPIFMIGEVAVDLKLPDMMKSIVNTAVENTDTSYVIDYILKTSLEMLILLIIGGFFGLMCCYTASKASQGFGNDVRIASFKKVMSLSLEQTDKFTTGSLVTRLTNDITTVQDVIQMMLRMLPRAPMFFIGGLYMCLRLDLSFFYVVAIALPIILAIVLVMVFKATPLFSVVQKKLDRVNSVVQETVTGARVVKAYSREEYEIDRFDVANRDYQKVNLKVSIIMSTIFPLMSIVVNATVIAIIYIGGLRVQAAALNVGHIMA
ncbi:MAG: ABC transporter ATP-binding protein, partial [Clostridia bacterium]|nr:ABC transporter ATP-binding protein [Clostridia bacterium]